jgi:invasion protein IalB
MKKLIAIILLTAAPAFAWEFDTYTNEMGDISYKEVFAFNEDQPKTLFTAILWDGRLMIVIKPDMRFIDGSRLDIKIDDHKIVRLTSFEKQGAVFAPAVPDYIWGQLLSGNEAKIRFFTQAESHTVSFSLEGIAAPLTKLLEAQNDK